MKVISRFLSERGPTSDGLNGFVLQLLSHILTKKLFSFDGSHFLQVQGVAMGTFCAPSYANLYLGGCDLFSNKEHMDLVFDILCWFRYIDNIFML